MTTYQEFTSMSGKTEMCIDWNISRYDKWRSDIDTNWDTDKANAVVNNMTSGDIPQTLSTIQMVPFYYGICLPAADHLFNFQHTIILFGAFVNF